MIFALIVQGFKEIGLWRYLLKVNVQIDHEYKKLGF